MNCNSCGKEIQSADQEFCDGCGARVVRGTSASTQQVYTQAAGTYQGPQPVKINNTKQLVFSIINLLCCCFPLGIVALVFAVTAKNEPTPELQEKKLASSMKISIIGMIVGGIAILISIIVSFIGPLLASL